MGYQRRTQAADALIAGTYLAGTNTRRVRRALAALFGGTVGKDTVSRVWRKVKADWEAWNARSLAEEPIVRLILDGTVVRVRLDRKATAISLLVVIGVREDGQKVLLALKTIAFGFFIAIVTCYHGLAQPLRLEDVSRVAVRAVSQGVIVCVLLDALFILLYLVT